MLVGGGTRETYSAEDTVAQYRELQQAGAGFITIRDQTGRQIDVDDLIVAITPASGRASGTEPNA